MTTEPNSHKAQSAMEYLMTYGWAILIIAVVLAALFALGVFNGSNLSGNSCQATPGFLCSNPTYSHTNANISVTLGQETGINWIGANFVFVPSATPFVSGVPAISFNAPGPANVTLYNTGLVSGAEATLNLSVNNTSFPVAVGSPIVGTIWAQYTYVTGAAGAARTGTSYAQIAALNLRAS